MLAKGSVALLCGTSENVVETEGGGGIGKEVCA